LIILSCYNWELALLICGIDPGLTGYAVTLSTTTTKAYILPLSVNKDKAFDSKLLRRFLFDHKPDLVVLEKPIGRGIGRATAIYNQGVIYGQIWESIKLMPHRRVDPKAWQKLLHEGISPKIDAKARSLISYQQLWPHEPIPKKTLKTKEVDHNAIDAMLMATYGVLKFGDDKSIKRWVFT